MMKTIPIRRSKRPGEDGYILVAVVFMLAILVVGMSVAAPKIAKEIQRDRERETVQRGKQYVRAIKLYYHKFGTYPPNVDALVNTNGVRFLRTRYTDPMTGKDDWKPILIGQNKTPPAMGFFGQPLGLPGAPAGGGLGSSPNGGSGSDADPNSFFGTGNSGTPANPGSNAGESSDANSGSGSTSTSGTDPAGQTFGGGGIIGFSPASPKPSILSYKKMNNYNEWEFLYSPLADKTVPQNPVNQPQLQGGAPGAPPQLPGSQAPIPQQ
jgi:type II secretory pathway pseudopilin PulG